MNRKAARLQNGPCASIRRSLMEIEATYELMIVNHERRRPALATGDCFSAMLTVVLS
jgi:hypothetical protein